MQHTASLVQIAASRRSPALVAGVGAAVVASAITLSVMMCGGSGSDNRKLVSSVPMNAWTD
jgi:hypothetical protein